jgi:hypothetical protein
MSRLSAADSDRLPLIQGRQGRYYVVDGKKYDEHFPQEWALNHLPYEDDEWCPKISGPKHCGNCDSHGSINEVFIFYCVNCMNNLYTGDKKRGGFIYTSLDATEQELWTQFPYMNGVKFDEIGDAKVPTHWNDEDDESDEEYRVMQKNGQRLRQRKNKLQKKQHKQNKVAQVVVDNIQQITENARIERKKRTEKLPYEAVSSDGENTTHMDEEDSSSDDEGDIHASYAKNHPTHIFYLLFLILWTVGLIYYAYLNIK